jgi:FixJ family two-component response regulator
VFPVTHKVSRIEGAAPAQKSTSAAARELKMESSTVFVIDQVAAVRQATSDLLAAEGYRVLKFESAEGFLAEQKPELPGCLLVDVCLPGLNGLQLQYALKSRPCPRPIVFLADRCDVQTSVSAMKAGAVDFLMKPTEAKILLAAIHRAVWCDADQRSRFALRTTIQQRFDALTPRERQVMKHVIGGKLNKQIAADLGTGEQNVKMHRARVMSKMRARSVPELVQLGTLVGVLIEPTQGFNTASIKWRHTASQVSVAVSSQMMA